MSDMSTLKFYTRHDVAYKLMNHISQNDTSIKDNKESIIELYRNCLWATKNPLDPTKK